MRRAVRTKILAGWLLLSIGAAAQSLPWIDISGEWKIALGDDEAWARPGLDDSGWRTVRLPQLFRPTWSGQPLTWFWLRRSVELPAGDLSLTLGRLVENYEVYVDGVRVGRVGEFEVSQSQLARPRTFDLSGGPARRAVIAIRCWRHGIEEPGVFRQQPDDGPYLITGQVNAPRSEGTSYLERMRLRRSPDLVLGVTLATIGGILLLILLRQRQRRELLWLSCTCLALASMRLWIVLSIADDTYPWQGSSTLVWIMPASTGEFLMAAFSLYSPWVRAVVWALTAWGLLISGSQAFNASLAIFPFLLVWVAMRATRRDGAYWLMLIGCLALAIVGLKGSANIRAFTSWLPLDIALRVGPYQWNLHAGAWALMGLAMVTVVVQRLLSDSAQKQRLAGELEAARVVQQLLLPAADSAAPGLSVEAVYEPAQEVGGDFHWRTATDQGLVVVAGDVSGKGLKAAMLVSVVIGILRQTKTSSPAAVLEGLNEGLTGHTGGAFITCCCARFEGNGMVTMASAGHPAPYVDGEEAPVESGLPLGIAAGVAYKELSLRCERFTLASDGVMEAANAKGELFGFERTREISTRSAREITAAARAWGQNDDITVLTVQSTAVQSTAVGRAS